jgi:hypothetical protein
VRQIFLGMAITVTWLGCTTSEVTIAPPRVPQGGRAVAIAVSQSNEKRIIVGTESGGLFGTFDGGKTFQHLDGFPTYAPMDVAIASRDPNIIIATARDDFRTVSGGGIWRSTDGGGSWSRPAGWPPPTCPGRPEGRGISHMPLTSTFYVATACGIAVSTNNGASFSMVVLDPARPSVRAILVLNRSTGVAADDTRLWFLNGGTWRQATGGPVSLGEHAIHALAAPWWTGLPIFYHAGRDRALYVSTDAGANWEEMATPEHGGGREKLVRVGRGLDSDPTHFDVYFGDGFTIWRQGVTTVVPGGHDVDWRQPHHMDHRDPADVAFTPGFELPLMLATDGGVHLTPDKGGTWKLTGSNVGGFTALQIGEMTGRAVGGASPHLDLYYATQDNDIKGSADGGQTWKGSIGAEGAFLSADAASSAHVDGPVTGRKCDNCTLFQAPPHLGNTPTTPAFHSAPDGNTASRADPPVQIFGPRYLQHVPSPAVPSFDYFFTKDRGATWAFAFSLPTAPLGNVKLGGSLGDPVAYVGVRRPFGKFGLFRIQGATTQASVRPADGGGVVSLGLLKTFQATYTVFGVDPSRPDHLLAADVTTNEMKASRDGGLSWFPLPALTAAVTDNGRFLFKQNMASFPTVIAWDPANTCHILVGTMQNGVIRSADGGRTWNRLAGSTLATYVTSFFFPPTGKIWMSTYGRGLWTLSVDRAPPASGRCSFPRPPRPWPPIDTSVVFELATRTSRPFEGLRDPLVCPTCTVLTARSGWITDVAVDGDMVRKVVTNPGMLVELDRAGKEVPLSVPNAYSDLDADRLRRLLGRELTAGRQVRGLVLQQRRVVGFILSRDELPWPAARTPTIYVASGAESGSPSIVESGGFLEVSGRGFLPGTGGRGVDILFGTDTVAAAVPVQPNGTFSARLPVSEGPALLLVSAAQRDGSRLTVAQESIPIAANEDPR